MCDNHGPEASYECALLHVGRLASYYGFREADVEKLETVGDMGRLASRVLGRAMAEFGLGVPHEQLVQTEGQE